MSPTTKVIASRLYNPHSVDTHPVTVVLVRESGMYVTKLRGTGCDITNTRFFSDLAKAKADYAGR